MNRSVQMASSPPQAERETCDLLSKSWSHRAIPESSANPCSLRWIVAQEGSRETYAVPVSLNRLGFLHLFYADVWCRRGRSLLTCGPKAARALATRFHAEIPREKVVSLGLGGVLRRAIDDFCRIRSTPAQISERYCRFGAWFARCVCEHLKRVELEPTKDLFFGYSTNCLETLQWLKPRGVFTAVDQVDPAKVEEDMVVEECERWPGWAPFPGRMSQDYWDRLRTEWNLADMVVVNSEWSASALTKQGVLPGKIAVVPLGIDLGAGRVTEPVRNDGPLKVLWLGSIILRKGIQYLAEAARQLQRENIEFLLAGPVGLSEMAIRTFPSNMRLLGRITRDELGSIYRQAHVFVLPTISDGFAVTQLEAMAHGLPVITTMNCGRVVTDGYDGFILPARDGCALAEAVARLNTDRNLLREMSAAALKSVGRYSLPSNGRILHDFAVRRVEVRKRRECATHD